jgi:hypothetical protein
MIHGGADTYIKPEMAQALFDRARQPKELWIVAGAKHNQAIQVAGDDYHRRICDFFEKHLSAADPESNGRAGDSRAAERGRRMLMAARAFFVPLLLLVNLAGLVRGRPQG